MILPPVGYFVVLPDRLAGGTHPDTMFYWLWGRLDRVGGLFERWARMGGQTHITHAGITWNSDTIIMSSFECSTSIDDARPPWREGHNCAYMHFSLSRLNCKWIHENIRADKHKWQTSRVFAKGGQVDANQPCDNAARLAAFFSHICSHVQANAKLPFIHDVRSLCSLCSWYSFDRNTHFHNATQSVGHAYNVLI